MIIGEILARNGRMYGDETALIEREPAKNKRRTVTWREFDEMANRVELASVPLTQDTVFLKVACDFKERTDKAYFYYSLDGRTWTAIGKPLQMAYSLSHFMGYRFTLFNYATKTAGGCVDFDYFRVSDKPFTNVQ